MNDPEIRKFLSKHDPGEWDTILGDLILYGIKKVKDIEKEEKVQQELEEKKKKKYLDVGPYIIWIKPGCEPLEYCMNYIVKVAESKSNPKRRKTTEKRLNRLNQQLDNINKGKSKNKKRGKSFA